MTLKYWIKYLTTIQVLYISLTYAIVFMYQQQRCQFATEKRIIEQSWWGNNKYLFVKENFIL